jgi:2-polyprenyl-3-methyl-5-hydroxy-6-metoxy-1,4-benzoquinol methylase
MTYRSVYTDQYQRPDEAGARYERDTSNRFELAIYDLERRILRDLHTRLLGGASDVRYLDFACGTGRILSVFRDRIGRRVGIDTSAYQLEVAQRKDPAAHLICGNLVTQPELLAGRRFDLITCFRLLLHLEPEYRVPVLRRIREHLGPSGWLIADNHMNRYSALGLAALFAHKVLRVPRKPFVPPGRRGISATLSEAEMRRALGEAGFEVVEVHRLFVLPGHGSVMMLPRRWLVALEGLLGRVPGVRRLSKNQIYVCRPLSPGGAVHSPRA